MRCPDCREVESQVCNLHAMGDRDQVDVEMERLKARAEEAEDRAFAAEAQSELRRVLLCDASERAARLTRERDEARQARRMAEEEVEQLRARIRGD